MAVQLTSTMQWRQTGKPDPQKAPKDLDDLAAALNSALMQIAALQATVTQIQNRLAAGATSIAVVGNSTQTGSSSLEFSNGIFTKFTP